jgi:4-hydroxythreonine-4-phosphate dehydrogenase
MKKRIGITIGDPGGIGPEIVLKALAFHPEIFEACVPVIFGPAAIVQNVMDDLRLTVPLQTVSPDAVVQNTAGATALLVDLPFDGQPPAYGQICAEGGQIAFEAITAAIEWARKKQIAAIATAPINKQALKLAGIEFTDHTAIFSRVTNSRHTMTLFVAQNLRIFFYSRHIPLKDVPARLNRRDLLHAIEYSLKYLNQLGIEGRLAVAALNPHGGDNGLFGDEELKIIHPAVAEAQKRGWRVSGPIPADSVFYLNLSGHFDAVLSLYHDQGHIAAKTYDFLRTVSFTMGLPFLRTSVDHGTAMELAGQNKANEISMVEAILQAAHYAWPAATF